MMPPNSSIKKKLIKKQDISLNSKEPVDFDWNNKWLKGRKF
jgi:hypothetical protein